MTRTRKNQRGGVISVENRKNHLIYTLKNTLNANILSKILPTSSLHTNEKTRRERNVAFINVAKNSTGETADFIGAVSSSPNASEILKSPIEYLSMIRNKFDGSFKNNPNTSSSLTESEKREIFGNSNIGPKNPETEKYFLKKGTGNILIPFYIEDARKRGIKTILLEAVNNKLVEYYSKFGFKIVRGAVYHGERLNIEKNLNMFNSTLKKRVPQRYKNGSILKSGKIMYIHL